MTNTEHTSKTPLSTGIFAALRALLRVKGSGAPKISRSVILSVLATTLGALAFTTAPALAATPPEARTEGASEVKAESAVLNGVVNAEAPGFPVEAGKYQFLYKATKTATEAECLSGSKAPAPAGTYLGATAEPFPQEVKGLKPNTEYVVCFVAENNAKQKTVGSPVTFQTTPEKPEPTGKVKAGSITATTAEIEGGVLDPKAAGEGGEYQYVYRVSATECEGEGSSAAGSAAGALKEHLPVVKLENLQPNATYAVCLVERDGGGSSLASTVITLKTSPAPPVVEAGSESASADTPTEETLHATINPNNEKTKYFFEYSTSEAEVLAGKGTQVAGAGELENFGGQGVEVSTGAVLIPDTTYFYRVIAENEQSEIEVKPDKGTIEHFQTFLEAPEELSAEPTGHTAKLRGVLNPNNAGDPVKYEFLYKQSESECELSEAEREQRQKEALEVSDGEKQKISIAQRVSEVGYGAGGRREAASVEVGALEPGAKYTFCLRVHNEVSEAQGAPETFETSIVGAEDSPIVAQTEAGVSAEIGTDEAATTYEVQYGTGSVEEHALPSPEASIPASPAPVTVHQHLASLLPATTYRYRFVADNGHGPIDGEERTFTTPATPVATAETCPNAKLREEQPYGLKLPDCRAYEMVSPVNSDGQDATEPFGVGVPRAAASGEAVTYAAKGNFAEPTGGQSINQILSRRGPEGWSTESITALQHPVEEGQALDPFERTVFTPELTEGIALSNAQLTANAPPSGSLGLYLANFAGRSYRYVGLGSIGVPAGASVDLSHVVTGKIVPADYEYEDLGEWVNGVTVPVAVANDGQSLEPAATGQSHSVSADGSRVIFGHSGELYVRVNAERPQGGEACEDAAGACTVKLSGPGAQYLGANSEDTKVFYTENEDLYEYELPIGSVKGEATDLTPGGKVQGVAQISEDGSHVYFVAKGVLTGVEENQRHEKARSEEDNLYLYAGGHVTFIATLAANDGEDWRNRRALTAVAPAGTYLAFSSERSLTGYDNEQAQPGECESEHTGETGRCRELYLYDAEADRLVCASCDPTGARPVGPSTLSNDEDLGLYRPRNIVEGGTLFFDSADALVPHASDARGNVYEYQDGQIDAISDVAGGYESFFLDASANGQNVFFATADQLLPQDVSNNVVVYDARVDGGFPVTVASPACTTAEACRTASSPTPGVYGPPASATFSGPGNVTGGREPNPTVVKPKPKAKTVKCKKGDVKNKQGRCVKKPKKKTKAKKSAHTNRRTH